MAVLKYLSKQDSTIYSFNPTQNAGLDEILTLIISNGRIGYNNGISRILLEFDNTDLLTKYNQITSSKDIFLKLFVANAYELPSEYTIDIFNINDEWKNGYGRQNSIPVTQDGVSWKTVDGENNWTQYNLPNYSSYSPNSYSSSNWLNNVSNSVSFDIYSDKNINTKISSLVLQQFSQSLDGGFLVKFNTLLEQDDSINSELNFYAKDTHTIYQPLIELRWDDSVYNVTGSLIDIGNYYSTLGKNKSELVTNSVERISILSRDRFPSRTFVTGSLYASQKYLPETTYYAVKDLKTGQFVIDFDNNYTKVSRDSLGNYFDLYLQNFEQNRYYQIEIKIVIDGKEYIHKDSYTFKVVK